MSKKHHRAVLESQTREIIGRVYDFMKKEALNHYVERLSDARWRTAQAAGISESTVTRILREGRKRTKEKQEPNFEDLDKDIESTTELFILEPFIDQEKESSVKQNSGDTSFNFDEETYTPKPKKIRRPELSEKDDDDNNN